jgi:beta-glucosidase
LLLKFPDNFYWGTATAAYQVEGGIRNNWSAAGEKFDAGVACDHYHRFEEDFDLAKSMNNNAHRFSIEWARIEPIEGNFNQVEIEHYRQVISALRKRGIEPFVTLYHWTLPTWFSEKGGWLDIGAPQYFARFTEKIVEEYKGLVKFWITINEPNIYTAHSFLRGAWPPFKKSFYITQQVIRSLVESHKKAYEVIHKIDSDALVGITNNNNNFKGILKFFSDDYWNHQFFRAINNYQDFIGVNYYFSSSVFDVILRAKEKSDLNWKIDPKGIYYVLKDLKTYNKPVYIMENGLADAKDEKREKFINNHLEWVHKAIGEGVDVRGYFHWSLLDNFEWDKGFEPRFGLVEVDYKTLKRIPRPSSFKYAEICKSNSIKT